MKITRVKHIVNIDSVKFNEEIDNFLEELEDTHEKQLLEVGVIDIKYSSCRQSQTDALEYSALIIYEIDQM